VAAANLAFALELYIKTLLAEFQINVPRGHDLGKLYGEIPQSVRDEIEKSYATWRKDWYGRRASITIAKGPANQPKWHDYRGKSNDLRALLDRSGDVFSSWRYIYEFTEPDQGNYQFHHFEYGLLLSACRAIQAVATVCRKALPKCAAKPLIFRARTCSSMAFRNHSFLTQLNRPKPLGWFRLRKGSTRRTGPTLPQSIDNVEIRKYPEIRIGVGLSIGTEANPDDAYNTRGIRWRNRPYVLSA
jgi:hypothetical protein